jgi:peptidoglycan/xylan/chitin deacetylase (PgdA/CDA1 family)
MIHRTPFFLPWLYPSLIWRMPAGEKELYLTFDDGPVTGPTDFVLSTLQQYNAKATFFCIGENIKKHPQLFRQILHHGHAIGNHTYNHLNGWNTTAADYRDNVLLCQNEIRTHQAGFEKSLPGNFFRPPYGRIKGAQVKMLSGFKIIMWDVLSVDYSKGLSPDTCLKNTIGATRNGSIIVFHDSFKAEKNLKLVLPRFIEYFSAQGFIFKAIE